MATIDSGLDWLGAHPVIWAILVWPIVTAFFNWLFRPRTEADYLALPTWLATTLRFIAALGLDPVAMKDALQRRVLEKKIKGEQ